MSISALIRAMSAAGAPPEAIALAVEAIEASEQKLADKRATERERKQRQRDRSRDSHGTVTGQDGDNPGPLSLDKESFPQTPFKEIKPNPVCDTPARKGTRISDNWLPAKPLPTNVKALSDQWPPGRYDRELDGFRDYWSSRQRNAAMLDWDKGWWNRIRDQHDKIMRENGNGRRTGNGMAGDRQPVGRTIGAALDFIQDGQRR